MVPFDKLGIGSGDRWRYQIVGRDASIYCPTLLEYLEASAEEGRVGSLKKAIKNSNYSSAVPLSSFATGLSGLNLLATAGVLDISPTTYHAVRELQANFEALSIRAKHLNSKLDLMMKLGRKIDSKISQANLREAIKHCFRKALTARSINLQELTPLVSDLNDLIESHGFDIFDLKLTSDIKDYLKVISTFLFDLRQTIAQQHNLAVAGDPHRVVCVNPTIDYLGHEVPHIANNFGLSLLQSHVVALLDADINNKLIERFEFAGPDDLVAFANIIKNSSEKLERYVSESIPQALITPVVYYLTGTMYAEVEAMLDHLTDESPPAEVRTQLNRARKKSEQIARSILESPQRVEELVAAWLWQTDGGVVLRTYVELLAIRDGYQSTFWSHLKGHPLSGLRLIEVDCDFSKISWSKKAA